MTRTTSRHLLSVAICGALASLTAPAYAQTMDILNPTSAAADTATTLGADAFQVTDIRVDGLQRITPGTVFTYLPIRRGDMADQNKAGDAIKALYKTGFFETISIDRQGSIMVVTVVERPSINKLTLVGNKDIKTEELTKGLSDIGLSEGGTLDRLALDRVTQELTRQYNNRGKYNVEVTPTVTKLDRNRVDLLITVKEGKAARIKHINLVGNDLFSDKLLTKEWESRTSSWKSWYSRDDQYSREKLSGDLEKLNNFYLDRGYIDVAVDSPQVSISPDRQQMYITAGIVEGEQYKISDISISGETILPKEEVEKYLFLRKDTIFSRRLLELTQDAITAQLGNIGYSSAQVTPEPQVDRENKTVSINLKVSPGPRMMVRRVVFKGNDRTSDEVLRREMRQFEGTWYSQAAIDRSKLRLQGLGFFDEVNVENKEVAGTTDQVDVVYSVKETQSGQFMFGLGYSQLSGLTTSIQLSQNNFLGTGNRMSVQAQRSSYERRFDFSFVNPYFTDTGVSLGYNLWYRDYDSSSYNTAQYSTKSYAAQAVLSVPLTETDSITGLFGIDSNQVNTIDGYTPTVITDYINAVGQRTFHSWRAELGWGRNTLNHALMPTAGTSQRIWLETTLPGSTVEYYKLNYTINRFWPISRHLVINTRAELGYGDSYGDDVTRHLCQPYSDTCTPQAAGYVKSVTASGLPFFENFYAGGASSVRGFTDNTLGPRAPAYVGSTYLQPLGGAFKTVGSVEAFFPSLLDSPSARFSAFVDFGNVYPKFDDFDAGQLRVSTGVAMMWRSPMGPISISYALPIRKEDDDDIERLQFTFGGNF